jgi:hypothetical protein
MQTGHVSGKCAHSGRKPKLPQYAVQGCALQVAFSIRAEIVDIFPASHAKSIAHLYKVIEIRLDKTERVYYNNYRYCSLPPRAFSILTH